MARKLRLEYPGACYHVINRGNYRRGIFEPKGAAEAFERTLFEGCEAHGWRLHAYVIMSNHYHLAVETPEANLSDGMQWVQGTWANRFNRYHGESGRPFQGRFKGIHIEPGHALAQVGHYIHLNPVRAQLVYPDWVRAYRWSSLWWFRRPGRPDCLEPETVLSEAGRLSDDRNGWKCYCEYLALLAEDDPKRRDGRFSNLSRGWAIGSKDFRSALIKDLKMKGAKGAAEAFERTLFEGCEAHGWRLHAYVIMSNHYHLAVETPEANLSDGMQWVQGTWANRFTWTGSRSWGKNPVTGNVCERSSGRSGCNNWQPKRRSTSMRCRSGSQLAKRCCWPRG